jgi:hypothetical protein
MAFATVRIAAEAGGASASASHVQSSDVMPGRV